MIPTLDDLIEQMQSVSGAPEIDADTPLTELSDVDSMDLMEWLYGYQSANPDSGVDADVFANEDGSLTLRIVHERLSQRVTAGAVG
ncbi:MULTISPECIES: hypothetical protein [unclassified Rathayibacter]|uniref:hypothetical protein n=1 Tax=unclassified Rathayibacter TaxID=2609250 RepID=UPI00188B79AC|nr:MULTISPECIES: hypothetical protein [unclassified Rathayibacter]MBF4463160.1 hypothetical protein [Rathayibacter sp. VKM Ac-2879]MBF4504603.1 hypothetical protein [Rathayibacter sp. VKM Ac-2878]